MKKIFSLFIVLCFVIISYVPAPASQETVPLPEQISSTFKSSSETFIGEGNFIYDENDFNQSAYTYNHSLAKMSLRLSMSAFAKNSDGYKSQYQNTCELMEKLNFGNISWNDDYTVKPTTNSIGVIAGNKKVQFEDGAYTLIAVAVRGGQYEAEWGGNFNVGNGELHEGFKIARDEVLRFLCDYIQKNNITENVKIWITGYSRGAATANLAAAYLDENTDLFGENVKISPDNIYAYCFETPAGVRNPTGESVYNNIFSVINRKDIVPMLPMEKWNYGRYGQTYYLPSAETNADYTELESRMYRLYNEYVAYEYKSEAAAPKPFYEYSFAWSFSNGVHLLGKKSTDSAVTEKFLKTIVDELAVTYESPENYSEKHQDAFVSFGASVIGERRTVEFFQVFAHKLTSRLNAGDIAVLIYSTFVGADANEALRKVFYDSIKATAQRMNITVNDEVADALFLMIVKLIPEHRLENLIGNIEILTVGHYPELCMAWMDATDETKYTDSNGNFVVRKDNSVTVTLNGNRIEFDQEPIIENGRTLVPLRKIFEALGASVNWNQETQTVTSVKDNTTVRLTIGSNLLYVNDRTVELDVPAQIVNNRTLAPARAVAESFDCNVDWDNDTRTVIITK